MAYTIRINTTEPTPVVLRKITSVEESLAASHRRGTGALQRAYDTAGALRKALTEVFVIGDWQERSVRSRGRDYYQIEIRRVRLRETKAYCGQHAGPCAVPRPLRKDGTRKPLPKMTLLETEDWIKMHGIVNGVLDACRAKATVWSTRVDTWRVRGLIGKFMIRTEERGGRLRYDYRDASLANLGMWPHYVFDPGTESQWRDGTGVESEYLGRTYSGLETEL